MKSNTLLEGIIEGITPEKRIKDLEEKNKILKDNLKSIKKELEEKNKNLKKIKNELEEKNKNLEDTLSKTKQELEEKNKIMENNYNNVKTELDNYRINDYNEKYIGQKLENFYDVIISIRSIRDLSNKDEGWPIKWNKNIASIKEFLNSDKKLLKIGVLGNGNIGKSFLLSRLFNDDIPSGYSVITEGLSLKINQQQSYALLDSAGLQTPLLLKDSKNDNNNPDNEENDYGNLYRDKTQTENFIQNLILSLSDMLIIVVGKLTFNEQRLINRIKNVLSELKTKKTIFIVHNLFNFQTLAQVDEYINDTLMVSASFKLNKVIEIGKLDDEGNRRFYFIEKEKENSFDTYHLLMGREHTKAGDYYNRYTYDFLKERFNDFPHRTSLSIIDEIKKKFVQWSGDLLEGKIKDENIIIKKENDIETKFIFEDSSPEKEDKKLEKKSKIVPKACLSDELGIIFYRSSGYEPSYNCYVENNIFIVKLEVPGNVIIEDTYAKPNDNVIVIEGAKYEDNEDNEKKSIKEENKAQNTLKNSIINTRKFGKFVLNITIPNEIKLASELSIEEEDNIKSEPKDGIVIRRFRLIRRRNK